MKKIFDCIEKNFNIIKKVINMISIINIIFIIIGFIEGQNAPHSFNVSLLNNIHIIYSQTIIVLILQLIMLLLVNNKIKKISYKNIVLISLVIVITTLFIPVKTVSGVSYDIDENETNIFLRKKTITTTEYQNLYSITLRETEYVSSGMMIF